MSKPELKLDPEQGCTKCINANGCLLRQRLWDELTKMKGFVPPDKTDNIFVAVGNRCKAFELSDGPF